MTTPFRRFPIPTVDATNFLTAAQAAQAGAETAQTAAQAAQAGAETAQAAAVVARTGAETAQAGAEAAQAAAVSARPYDSVAAMVAATGLVVGSYISTRGYYTPGDGGANIYEVVAAGTGTADGGSIINLTGSGLQARGLFPLGYRWRQWGAVGDAVEGNASPTDNHTAMQAAINYVQSVSQPIYTDSRGNPGGRWGAGAKIEGEPGDCYGISETLLLNANFSHGVIEMTTLKAIGSAWTATDHMIDRADINTEYVTLRDVQLWCDRKCGGIQTQSFWLLTRVFIRHMAVGGFGLTLRGVKTIVEYPDIKEWTIDDKGFFYNDASYGATALRLVGIDHRVHGGEIGWCGKLIVDEAGNEVSAAFPAGSVNTRFYGVHLFNGMEDFATYNQDGSTRAANPSGTPAVGRANPIGFEKLNGPGYAPILFHGCYMDNCRIDLYDDAGVSFHDCDWNSNDLHSNADQTQWIRNYASEANAPNRLVVLDAKPGVDSRPKRLVAWLAHPTSGHDWAARATLSQWEDSDENLMTQRNAVRNLGGEFAFFLSEPDGFTISTTGPNAFVSLRDGLTDGWVRFGADDQQAVVSTPNGTMRVVDQTDGTVPFKIRSGSALEVKPVSSPPTAPIANGTIYYDDTIEAFRFYEGGQWNTLGSGGGGTSQTDYESVAALQSAVTGGASWADGTVITAGPVQFQAQSGAAITGLPAGLVPFGKVFAKHFGAVEDFDGSTGTNDRVAIQRAIDYQFSQGGGDVWIEGQSVVAGTVNLLAGVNIRRVREGSADLEQVGKTAYPITFDMGSAIIGSHSGGPVVRMHDLRSKLDITIGATEARRDAALLSTSATSWNGGVLVMKSADADVDPDEPAIVSNILEGLVVRDQPCDSIMIAQNVTSLQGIHCISISPGRCHLVIDNGAHIGATGEGRPGIIEIAHFKGANAGAEALRIGHPDNGPADIPYRVSISVFECFRSGVWKSQRFNPSTAVNTTTDTITVPGHSWSNGDKLLYSRGDDTSSPPTGNSVAGDDIGGLVSGTCYFVVNATTNTIQLSATSGGAAINLTDTGAGNYDHILSDVSRMTPILDGADELYAAAYVRGEQVSISNAAISGTSSYSGDAAHLHANWAINGQQIAIRESRMIAYRDSPILIFEAGGQENAGITLTNIHCANGNATDPANLVRFCGTVTVDDLRIEGITGNLSGFPIDIGAFRASHAGSCVVLHDGMRFETGYMQQVQDGYFTLADNAATSIPLLPAGFAFSFGLIAIGANTASSEPSIVAYRVGTLPFVQVISGSMTAGSGVLSGTTGTDGDITVSAHTDGDLYLENRRGGSSNFVWRLLVAKA